MHRWPHFWPPGRQATAQTAAHLATGHKPLATGNAAGLPAAPPASHPRRWPPSCAAGIPAAPLASQLRRRHPSRAAGLPAAPLAA